jgi:hypothetical protein
MRAAITFVGKTCTSHYSYQIVPSESFWGRRRKQLAEQLVFLGHVIVTLDPKSCNYTLVAILGLVEDIPEIGSAALLIFGFCRN